VIFAFQEPFTAAGAAIAAAVTGAFAFIRGNQSSSNTQTMEQTKAPEPIVDLSIPYDAATHLAFAAWVEGKSLSVADNKELYAKFKPLYESQCMAIVKAKKVSRTLKEAQDAVATASAALDALA